MDTKELNSFLFVQHPQRGNAYVTEGKMTLIDLKANSWSKSGCVQIDIYNRITPSCLGHLIQRKEPKYDLRHQHRVYSAQRFETYYMKNSISNRGSIVWNLLEPSAVSARDNAKRAKKSHRPQKLEL